jgi:hypothetical protein
MQADFRIPARIAETESGSKIEYLSITMNREGEI